MTGKRSRPAKRPVARSAGIRRAGAAGCRGVFIVFEGPEGSGKTTHLRRLAAHLECCGWSVRMTREPGGTQLGDEIRRQLLERGRDMAAGTELALFLAQRIEHLRQVIEPALAAGQIVISDRHADSSRVYQGVARGLGLALVDRLHRQLGCECRPALTILLDLDPQVGLARAQASGRLELDRIETETRQFHQRVREGYLALARSHPRRYLVIDASAAPSDVFAQILAGVARLGILAGPTAPRSAAARAIPPAARENRPGTRRGVRRKVHPTRAYFVS